MVWSQPTIWVKDRTVQVLVKAASAAVKVVSAEASELVRKALVGQDSEDAVVVASVHKVDPAAAAWVVQEPKALVVQEPKASVVQEPKALVAKAARWEWVDVVAQAAAARWVARLVATGSI